MSLFTRSSCWILHLPHPVVTPIDIPYIHWKICWVFNGYRFGSSNPWDRFPHLLRRFRSTLQVTSMMTHAFEVIAPWCFFLHGNHRPQKVGVIYKKQYVVTVPSPFALVESEVFLKKKQKFNDWFTWKKLGIFFVSSGVYFGTIGGANISDILLNVVCYILLNKMLFDNI